MKMQIELTKSEFEEILVSRLLPYGQKGEISGLYLRLDGGAEFTIEAETSPAVEEPVRGQTVEEPPPSQRLWTADPPPLVQTVQPEPPANHDGWWPEPENDVDVCGTDPCFCRDFYVSKERDWVYREVWHRLDACVSIGPAPVSDAAALSASSTGEHGTVESDKFDDDIPF